MFVFLCRCRRLAVRALTPLLSVLTTKHLCDTPRPAILVGLFLPCPPRPHNLFSWLVYLSPYQTHIVVTTVTYTGAVYLVCKTLIVTFFKTVLMALDFDLQESYPIGLLGFMENPIFQSGLALHFLHR